MQGRRGQAPAPASRPPDIKFAVTLGTYAQFVSNWGRLCADRSAGEAGLNVRLTLMLAALGTTLAACASTPKLGAIAPQPEAALSHDNPVGHKIEEIVAINGPPSQQWDLPDGRRGYRWQSSSISASVAPARKGEIRAAGVSQSTCYYTLYAKADAKGVVKVVAADEPSPGCMKLAMVGQAK